MFSAKHWGVIGPCFCLLWRWASPRLVSPFSHCWALNPTNSISARELMSTRGSSFIEELPKRTLRKYSRTNCTLGTRTRFTPGRLICSKARSIPHFLQKHKKFIQHSCIAEFMHFLNGFSCIQPLRHL